MSLFSASCPWLLGQNGIFRDYTDVQDREKLEHQNILLSELARKDPMTGLLNRGALQELVWSTVGGSGERQDMFYHPV